MIQLDVKVTSDTWTPLSRRIRRQLAQLPQLALNTFKNNTPIKTGYARSNTRLINNSVITANYAYAETLDRGYSNQSPRGMTKPTEEFVRTSVKKIIGV